MVINVRKTLQKVFVIISGALVVVALFYFPLSNSYLGLLLNPFFETRWEEIQLKFIVKNSLVISLIEREGEKCKVSSPRLGPILDHQYFVQADNFANKVNYDPENNSIILPCNVLPEEDSRLHVWYVTEDSPDYPTRYKYYVSTLSETISDLESLDEEKIPVPESGVFDEIVKSIPTENPYAKEILAKCGADEICAIVSLRELSNTVAQQTIFETVYDILSAYQKSGLNCHERGHHLGEFLYGQTGNLTESISLALDRKCSNALTMGIVENYFKTEIVLKNTDPENIEFIGACDQFGTNPYGLGRLECVHGIGHGLAIAYDYEVFSAVKRCDEFQTEVEKRLCYEGLFMENIDPDSSFARKSLDENDLLFPCNQLEEKYAGACYYYQISYILRQKGNVADSLKVCDELENKVFVKFCYLGMGRQISTSFFDNYENIVTVCGLGLPEYQNFCLQGALIVITEDLGIEHGFEACKIFPKSFKQSCYTLMGSWLSQAYSEKSKIELECSKAESIEYLKICTNAANEDFINS